MSKQDTQPWQQIEEQAFHAFREWHVWLVLRARELATRVGAPAHHPDTTQAISSTTANPSGDPSLDDVLCRPTAK